jgi:hypothetical protein
VVGNAACGLACLCTDAGGGEGARLAIAAGAMPHLLNILDDPAATPKARYLCLLNQAFSHSSNQAFIQSFSLHQPKYQDQASVLLLARARCAS